MLSTTCASSSINRQRQTCEFETVATNLLLLVVGPLTKETSRMLGILGHLFDTVEVPALS